MTDTTDPTTGFTVRNSLSEAEYADAQAAAREAAQPEPGPLYGDVKQGAGRDTLTPMTGYFTTAQLNDFAFFTANKAAILAADARSELPGQHNHPTNPLDN